MEFKSGVFPGRGIEGSVQLSFSGENKTMTVAVDLELPALGGRMTTFLYFTEASKSFAIERLRALGWEGTDPSDIKGISKNEVPVRVFEDTYKEKKTWKCEIQTGGVRLEPAPVDEFKARWAALFGGNAGAAGAAPGTPSTKPPF